MRARRRRDWCLRAGHEGDVYIMENSAFYFPSFAFQHLISAKLLFYFIFVFFIFWKRSCVYPPSSYFFLDLSTFTDQNIEIPRKRFLGTFYTEPWRNSSSEPGRRRVVVNYVLVCSHGRQNSTKSSSSSSSSSSTAAAAAAAERSL